MGQITLEIDDTQVVKAIDKLIFAEKDTKKVFEGIGEELLDLYASKNFATEGAALQDKWKPLASATILARTRGWGHYRKSGAGNILQWTGDLINAFDKVITHSYLIIKNNNKYFKFHQKGGKNLPKRTMLKITRKVEKIVVDHFEKHFNKAVS